MVLRRSESGYSLIEALVAAGVLLLIAVGILPLFLQAIVNNKQGGDSTTVTTFSKSSVESLLPVPFDAAAVTVPAGSTSLATTEWYVQQSAGQLGGSNGKWVAGATPPTGMGQVLWQRTTTVQQFSVNDLTFATPEDGATAPQFVHLKQIQVVVRRPIAGVNWLASGKTITLQTMRAD
jgi:hypothetical protein